MTALLCVPVTAAAGPFTAAVDYAQARTVKVYGAAIARESGYATGIVVSRDGRILVSNGIYLAGERVQVVLADGTRHRATVLRRSQAIQTALLKIDAQTPEFFEVPDKLPVAKGDWVLAVSNAFKVADAREKLSVNLGVVSLVTVLKVKRGTQQAPYDAEALLIDAITSNPGAAGGALVTADGKLAGMVGKLLESRDTGTRLNYAVPAHLLARFMAGKSLAPAATTVAGGKTGVIGVRLFSLGGRRSPAFIDRVVRGSAAQKAGLRSDDLILSIDGERVRNVSDYKRLTAKLIAGKPVKLMLKRRLKVFEVTVTPEER